MHNAYQLFREILKRGYRGGVIQVGRVIHPWRGEEQERAFVRFETGPGEQCQMDWGHFGNWAGCRLYAFALSLCFSRMRYVEFTQRQDSETLLNCLVHASHYLGGVTASLLTDNMKTVVLERRKAAAVEPALSGLRRQLRFRDVANNLRKLNNATSPGQSPYFVYRAGRLVIDDSFRSLPALQPRQIRLVNIRIAISNQFLLLQAIHTAARSIRIRLATEALGARNRSAGEQSLEHAIYREPVEPRPEKRLERHRRAVACYPG